MSEQEFIPFSFHRHSPQLMMERATHFYQLLNQRRSLREFSSDPVPRELVEILIKTASTAPSGAHKQPWRFVLVDDPQLKREIRLAAEEEERENYSRRFPPEWLKDLEAFGTNWEKPFLEIAPWLVVLFKIEYELTPEGEKKKHYYVNESVGLAGGMFLAAVQNAGLVSLTHTPNPMKFLREILQRPINEKPYLLMPLGYPAEDAKVPNLQRKELSEIAQYNLEKI